MDRIITHHQAQNRNGNAKRLEMALDLLEEKGAS